MFDNIVLQLKELLPYAEETTLKYYTLQATNDFLNLTHLDAVPPKAITLIVPMVMEIYNQVGYEGLSSSSTGGVDYKFQTNYSPRLLSQISYYRRIAW